MRKSVLCLLLAAVEVFRQHRRVNETLLHFINREVWKVRTATGKEEGEGEGGAKKGNVSHLRWQLAQRDLAKPP